MTMKLKGFVNYQAEQVKFMDAVRDGGDEKAQNEAFANMMNALSNDILGEARKEAQQEAQDFINASRIDNKISPEEIKFFNTINTDVGYKEEKLLPQTVIDEIFEDLVTEHPFLATIQLKNAGLRIKFLKSETSGVAVWGKVFGEIKGQLDAAFSEEETIQNKLTAFVVIPKDLDQFGPAWIKTFVITQITEAFAVQLEAGFIAGSGKDMPIGLNRSVKKGVSVTDGAYPEKVASGKLTFADSATTVKELTAIHKLLSVKENGQPLEVNGKVILLVNPTNAWDVRAQWTSLNAQGVFVTALPFNVSVVESVAVKAETVISFIAERYDAFIGGGVNIQQYNETLALEDMNLFTAKQFVYGKAKDDKAAAVWTLELTPPTTPPEETTPEA